jgi:hypothetical protein
LSKRGPKSLLKGNENRAPIALDDFTVPLQR